MKRLCVFLFLFLLAYPAVAAPLPPGGRSCQSTGLTATNYYERANDHYNAQNWRAAIADYTCALVLDSTNIDARYWRATAYYWQNDYLRAIADYDLYLEQVPDNQDALTHRGIAHYYLENYEQAVADFDRIIVLAPEDGFAYNWRGWMQYMAGDFEQAAADYERTLNLTPDEIIAHIDLAMIYAELGQTQKAIDEYHSAVEMNPGLGVFYTGDDLPNYAGYVEIYTPAITHWPDNFISRIHRANCYARLGEFEAAIADFNHASELAPEFADSYAGLGSVYDRMGELDEALSHYQQYLELAPEPDAAIVARVAELEAE